MKPGNIVQVAMSYGKTKKSFMIRGELLTH